MTYAIVFSSRTGNTKLLAETIRACLGAEDCLYFGPPDPKALQAQRIYLGFWTDKGSCDADTTVFLDTIENREVFLFGTAGFGGGEDYFNQILGRVKARLHITAQVKGTFMCQGKMPPSVRERYVRMKDSPVPIPNLQNMIDNFDRALTHPDEDDLAALRRAVEASLG